MGIPIGKLSLYTACGGIDPATTLPIQLNLGTGNQERLADPLYIGWKHERVRGADYDAFVESFVPVTATGSAPSTTTSKAPRRSPQARYFRRLRSRGCP